MQKKNYLFFVMYMICWYFLATISLFPNTMDSERRKELFIKEMMNYDKLVSRSYDGRDCLQL